MERPAPAEPDPPAPWAVEAIGVEKVFADVGIRALAGANLQIAPGTSVGLVGPEDSGKSTLLRILAGRLPASRGQVRVLGRNPIRDARELLPRVGYVPTQSAFPPGLSASDVARLARQLSCCGDVFAFARVCTALELDPNGRADRFNPTHNQLLSLALALQKSPEVLIVDDLHEGCCEETKLYKSVEGLRSAGVAMVFAARRLEQIISYVDTVCFVRGGCIVDSVSTQRGASTGPLLTTPIDALAPALPEGPGMRIADTSQLFGAPEPEKVHRS
jgi:ABC-2 type transport system ATP-binding protein